MKLVSQSQGQSIAEYALMLALILVLVIATVKTIGNQTNSSFQNVNSALTPNSPDGGGGGDH